MPRQKSADASVITEVRCGRPGKRAYDIKGQRFEISSRYEPIGVVGVGAYGLVVSANDLEGGRRVAIKRVDGLFENLTDAKRILREIRLMRCLSHENVRVAWQR
jgi:serine/threonine protein kinase